MLKGPNENKRLTGGENTKDKKDKGYKLIGVRPNTYQRLRDIGTMGESFDGLINRLCEEYETALEHVTAKARGLK